MRLVCFNCNSLRRRIECGQMEAIFDKLTPDVLALQETKVKDDLFPIDFFAELGMTTHFAGQPTHYGVATASILPMSLQSNNLAGFEMQKRFLHTVIQLPTAINNQQKLHIINGYFPQGENRNHPTKFPQKLDFYQKITEYLHTHLNSGKDLVIVTGDMNVAPDTLDLGIPLANQKRWLNSEACCFLPEEQQWLKTLKDWGLTDSYRSIYPNKQGLYSWFDYRSKGFEKSPKQGLRIDFVFLSKALLPFLTDAGIDYDLRALETPSDHAPIWVDLNL